MSRRGSFIIQVGGAGKGCGKTGLIIELLKYFPGSVYIKTALHFNSNSPHGGDDQRCLEAGASESHTLPQNSDWKLDRIISGVDPEKIVFLEKNSPLKELVPNVYLFIDVPVSNLRMDSNELKLMADYIVTEQPVSQKCITEIVNFLKTEIET